MNLENDPIFRLSDELVRAAAELMPVMATYIGVPGHDHRFEDLSLAGHAHRHSVLRGFRSRLSTLDPRGDAWLALARRVMLEQLDQWLDAFEQGDHFLDLNSIDSPVQNMRMVFDVMDTASAEGWTNIAGRLEALPAALDGYLETLVEGVRRGLVVARRQVRAVLEQGAIHAGDGGWFASVPSAHARSKAAGDASLLARLEKGAAGARSAMTRFCSRLTTEYLPHAVEKDGVGEERYARAAARHLGMKLDAREAYAWGWDEVRRLESAMRETAARIDAGAAVPELVKRLKHDPDGCAASPAEFLRVMGERQAQAVAQLAGVHFEVPERARRIEVKIAPPGSVLGAYYTPPSEDFSRAGCVWYALGETERPPLFTEIIVAYHEGFPGHHLQIATQMLQAEKLSRFQRVIAGNTGHAEGWALYAEQLMFELGFLEKPEYVLGMLVEQLVRAYRVVVDIGLHLDLPMPGGGRWTYDAALEAMHGQSFLERDHAISEVVRYMGWPAQAIAYKLGQRAILSLRDERRKRDGTGFSLARFHERVLEVGSVGLDLLRELVS